MLFVEKLDGVFGEVGRRFWTRVNTVCGEAVCGGDECRLWRGWMQLVEKLTIIETRRPDSEVDRATM